MYDEPTAGLDPVASTVVEDLIRSLHVGRDGGDTSQKGRRHLRLHRRHAPALHHPARRG